MNDLKEKQLVTVHHFEVYDGKTMLELQYEVATYTAKHPDITDFQFRCEPVEYSDGDYHTILECMRLETDTEFKNRIDEHERRVKRNEEYEKEQYLRLKAKFEIPCKECKTK
jgi:hypothetical protein